MSKDNKGVTEPRTSKKVRVVGCQDYINPNTGELVTMQVTSVEERDFGFAKVWMRSFLATLDLVGNAKTKVAFWVVDHITKENMLPYTYRQIAQETGMSLDTVAKTMTTLLEADFLRRKNQGCYILNPSIVFKGTRAGRLNVMTEYQDAEKQKKPEPTPEERLQMLLQAIQRLTEQANKLSDEIKAKEAPLPGQMALEAVTEAPRKPTAAEAYYASVTAYREQQKAAREAQEASA